MVMLEVGFTMAFECLTIFPHVGITLQIWAATLDRGDMLNIFSMGKSIGSCFYEMTPVSEFDCDGTEGSEYYSPVQKKTTNQRDLTPV